MATSAPFWSFRPPDCEAYPTNQADQGWLEEAHATQEPDFQPEGAPLLHWVWQLRWTLERQKHPPLPVSKRQEALSLTTSGRRCSRSTRSNREPSLSNRNEDATNWEAGLQIKWTRHRQIRISLSSSLQQNNFPPQKSNSIRRATYPTKNHSRRRSSSELGSDARIHQHR